MKLHDPSILRDEDASTTIGQMSSLFGVSLRTLRFYEELGLLSPARSGDNRLYSGCDRLHLQIVLLGRKMGFSLKDIGALIRSREDRKAEMTDIFSLLDRTMIEERMTALVEQRSRIEESLNELRSIRDGRGSEAAMKNGGA